MTTDEVTKVSNDMMEINRRLFYDLWNVADVSSLPSGLSPRLILPAYREEDGDTERRIRISEQESRFLYCSQLNALNYYYSIETPTKEKYVFSGKKPRSAASDLSLYVLADGTDATEQDTSARPKAFRKVANVEFKAHNPPCENIRKDIEKLVQERVAGNWFHTLGNIDSKTLTSLFEKMSVSLKKHRRDIREAGVSIVFAFCVLEKKWACLKHFLFERPQGDLNAYVDEFFRLEYAIESGKVTVENKRHWQVFRL